MEIRNDVQLQSIQTKFLGPTNTKGARVKAFSVHGSVTIHWNYSKNVIENHIAAAEALAAKHDWDKGRWYIGSSAKGHGYVFVRVIG